MNKISFLVCTAFALMFGLKSSGQSAELLTGTWSADSYVNLRAQETPFTLNLTEGKFVLTGPDQTFPQFSSYLVEGNQLTVLRDKKFGDKPKRRAVFLIVSATAQELHLQALNWPAIYITDAVRSPKKKIDEGAYLNLDELDLNDSDLQTIELKLRRQ